MVFKADAIVIRNGGNDARPLTKRPPPVRHTGQPVKDRCGYARLRHVEIAKDRPEYRIHETERRACKIRPAPTTSSRRASFSRKDAHFTSAVTASLAFKTPRHRSAWRCHSRPRPEVALASADRRDRDQSSRDQRAPLQIQRWHAAWLSPFPNSLPLMVGGGLGVAAAASFQNIPWGLARGTLAAAHGAELVGSPTSCRVSQCSMAFPSSSNL